ncbi:MAG: FeoB-associated Cys-rich membrane protein [Bacteroidaceae bacterium]|nr:FeoB-associated Cys-rich membrane protein [Bacteroidaceae bacterium]
MNIQEIIVFLILACVVVLIIRNIYRQIKGKNHSCNCNSCPKHSGECHCHSTT